MSGPDTSEVRIFGGTGARRSWLRGLARGGRGKCPACGVGRVFNGYSRTHAACAHCGLDLTGHRADDAPPYMAILIVGHILIPLALAIKQIFDPPLGLQFAIFLPTILIAVLLALPVAKGALIGVQWANRMHGFGDVADPAQ